VIIIENGSITENKLQREIHVVIADESGTLLLFGNMTHNMKYIELTRLQPYQQFAIETGKSSDVEQISDEDIIRDKVLGEVSLQIINLLGSLYEQNKTSFFARSSAYNRGCEFGLNYIADMVNDLRNNPKQKGDEWI
jgi:hypothetical protein